MATVFEPIRPVPPITTIFMADPPLSTLAHEPVLAVGRYFAELSSRASRRSKVRRLSQSGLALPKPARSGLQLAACDSQARRAAVCYCRREIRLEHGNAEPHRCDRTEALTLFNRAVRVREVCNGSMCGPADLAPVDVCVNPQQPES